METEYEKYYKERAAKNPDTYLADYQSAYHARKAGIEQFGFAVLTKGIISMLKPHAPFIEVGAGTGYWSYELQKRGIRTIATDPISVEKTTYKFKKQWTVIEPLTGVEAVAKYPDHTMLLIWPCYDKSWAYETLKAYTGDKLIYCGEGYGGCTADNAFHELLADEWKARISIHIPQWYGLHDYLDVYVRKSCLKEK